jgi:predicted GIY-YIG superfamily endonuclease
MGTRGMRASVGMKQLLLLPDPRPLVERLGNEFFRQVPEVPGVYLMRDAADAVLYVGKARNLRKRLASYRVANPDRVARRHLRMLRSVARIELQECADEASALARESELLLELRPRFNRAGTWPGVPRFLAWRAAEAGLDLAVTLEVETGWLFHGPMGASVVPLHAALVRLCWCALHPERGLAGMPAGWFQGQHGNRVLIPQYRLPAAEVTDAGRKLSGLFAGQAEELVQWTRDRTAALSHPFEMSAREADLELLSEFANTLPADTANA